VQFVLEQKLYSVVSLPPGVIEKTVPQPTCLALQPSLAPPYIVVPYRLPSRPWTKDIKSGFRPSVRLKLTRLLNFVAAGEVIAVAAQSRKTTQAALNQLTLRAPLLARSGCCKKVDSSNLLSFVRRT
jgi:hypothetical protein